MPIKNEERPRRRSSSTEDSRSTQGWGAVAKRQSDLAARKKDLEKKLQEFATLNDNLEEVSENREQIEISRYYEKLPKPVLIATQEYIEGKVMYRNPAKEKAKLDF